MSTRPPGTWSRFITAVLALLGVAIAIPVLLIIVARASMDTGNPLPGLGSVAEIREWFGRELSTTEIVPVVLRSLLIVSWLLWLALMSSVLSALVAARPSIGHFRVPRLAMFDGVGLWIATGLTVLSSLSPKIALAESIPTPAASAAVVDQSATQPADRRVVAVPAGFERVETGESIEMFAERTLGDGARWPEVWELSRGTVVDPASGTTWDEPWRLEGGWQLRLPSAASTPARSAAVGDSTSMSEIRATQRRVEGGDSYWSISTDLLANHLDRDPNDGEILSLVDTLIERNAGRLGHVEPSMLHSGDVIDIDVDIAAPATVSNAKHVVERGDSYWSIAETTLWATTGERPAEADVFLLTQQLMLDNAERLGYDDPALIHPGDVIRLQPEARETRVDDVPSDPIPAETVPDATTEPTGQSSGSATAVEPEVEAPVADAEPTPVAEPTGVDLDVTQVAPPAIPSATSQSGRNAPLPAPGVGDSVQAAATTDDSRGVVPIGVLTGLSLLTAAGLASLIRRRHAETRQTLRPGRRLRVPSATTQDAMDDVLYRDVSDVTWMDHELRLLASLIDPGARQRMTIELVQLGTDRTLEVAFKEIVEVAPPGSWVGVADDSFDRFRLPSGVARIDEEEAFDLVEDVEHDNAGNDTSMLSRRTGRWESWPSTLLLLATESSDSRWDSLATSPSSAVLSTTQRFGHGVDLQIEGGTISIPTLGIEAATATCTEAEQLTIEEVLRSVNVDATEDVVVEPAPLDVALLEHPPEIDEDWEAPTWPVMINVLGPPRAFKDGQPIKLTPQQLSALALIATKREIPAHDFRRSIWGDEDDVSPERVRDMLSQLRKKVGGLRVIPKREDGLVCAGDDLGSDTRVFDALVERSAAGPSHRDELLHDALDLVSGRILDYSSSDSAWWRWSEIAFGSTDWTAKTTDVAAALAQSHLEQSEPAAARDVAERGLVADPLNAALTELLMEAYAGLGTLESAQRVYESHDRSLDMADLGGASAETRRVLERIRTAADQSADSAVKAS